MTRGYEDIEGGGLLFFWTAWTVKGDVLEGTLGTRGDCFFFNFFSGSQKVENYKGG